MKKALLWLSLVALLALPVLNAPTPKATAQGEGESARLETLFFSVEYPAGWEVLTVPFGDGMYTVISPTPIPRINAGEIINFEDSRILARYVRQNPVMVFAVGVAGASFDPAENASELLNEQDVIETTLNQPITLNGADGVEIETTLRGWGPLEGQNFDVHAYVLRNNETGIAAYAAAGGPSDIYAEYRDSFNKYLQSFSLAADPTAPVVVNNGDSAPIAMRDYSGVDFGISVPSDWEASSVDNADGSLTLFAPEFVEVSRSDFEALANRESPLNWALITAIAGGPLVGVLAVDTSEYYAYDFFEGSLEDFYELANYGLNYEWDEVDEISRVRLVELSNGSTFTEVVATINAFGSLEDSRFDLHILTARVDNMAYIFIASVPTGLADNAAVDFAAIFEYMAYSLSLK